MKSNSTTQGHYPDHSQWIYYMTIAAALLGMVTNAMNFCVFWCEPVRRHYLSVALRLLSGNDFLLLMLYFVLGHTNLHNWNQYTCFLTNYLYGLVSTMSPWLLVVITIDRLFFLHSPDLVGGSNRRRSPQRVCLLIKFVIAGSIGWCLHCRFTVGFGHHLGFNETKVCAPIASTHTSAFQLADSLIVAFVPGFALLILNCVILCKVRHLVHTLSSRRRLSAVCGQTMKLTENCEPSVPIPNGDRASREIDLQPSSSPTSESFELRKNQCQITRMLLGFCFAYLAFNLPNYLALVMGQLTFLSLDADSETIYAYYNMLRLVAQFLFMLHFSTNSVIYAYTNKLFRVALLQFLSPLLCCCKNATRAALQCHR